MTNRDIVAKAADTLRKEQQAIAGLRPLLGPALVQAVDTLASARGKIVVSGMGKSGQIGHKIASTLTSLGAVAVSLNPAEAVHGDLGVITSDDVVIAISHSGETKELLRLLRHVAHLKVPLVAITGSKKSSLASMSSAVLAYHIKGEGSPYDLAPMASATASLVIGDMLAVALCAKRRLTRKHFARAHPGGSLGLKMTKVSSVMKKRGLPVINTRMPFARALVVMTKGEMGVVAVTEGRSLLTGIMTDGDIRRHVLSGKLSQDTAVGNLMTKNPKTIAASASLQEALVKMEQYKITTLFVTDRGRLKGVVRMHDIVERGIL